MTDLVNSGRADYEFDSLRVATNYRRALTREFAPMIRGAVLEIGAGIGQMTADFRTLPGISRYLAIEPDATFHAEFESANRGVPLLKGFTHELRDRSDWDTALSINVLEHIENDDRALAEWAELLRRNHGRLGLLVPARMELMSQIDHSFGHFRRYTKPGLRRVLEAAGFEIERLHYFNLAGYFGWALMFRILKRQRFSIHSVRRFDRWIFPPMHAFERSILRPPFGQSLLAIARAR